MRKVVAVLSVLALSSAAGWARGIPIGGRTPERVEAPLAFSAAGPEERALLALSAPEVPSPQLTRDPTSHALAVSLFMGQGGGDIFAALHGRYAWKVLAKSMTVGLGVYREIPVYGGIGLLPYVGVIRSSVTFRPSDLHGPRETFELGLTAFCVGLPLVIRFN
ncbi:MAG TPA: hypothetical protein ENO03_01410 [Candidatus Aminicenantes bacterium]|nr:hypothetical protein [Candidatus Aminicenantes bacterium]HDT12993.1 hypothetical protein [Candidatus Aminicenantes bacterium]